jgi:hypothetical protein
MGDGIREFCVCSKTERDAAFSRFRNDVGREPRDRYDFFACAQLVLSEQKGSPRAELYEELISALDVSSES